MCNKAKRKISLHRNQRQIVYNMKILHIVIDSALKCAYSLKKAYAEDTKIRRVE